MGSKTYSKLLSICIPSYNRGHRALPLVRSLLEMDCISKRDDIGIILSNNGSTKYTEEYEIISTIRDKHFKYNRFPENILYPGNYNEIVKMSDGHYCLLISDEDTFDEKCLEGFIEFIGQCPDAGVLKTGTTRQYNDQTTEYFEAGEEALKAFYLVGNYISGTVYNRDYVTDQLMDGLRDLYKEDEGYYYYPHLFVEAYALNIAGFYSFSEQVIIEGEDEGDQPVADEVTVPVFASWTTRVAQLRGYYKLIRDLHIDDGRKQLMFMMATTKTIALIKLVKDKYLQTGSSWDDVYAAASNAVIKAVSECEIPVIEDNMEAYIQVIADFL